VTRAEADEQLVLNQHKHIECLTCGDAAVVARVRSVDGSEAVVAVGDGTERVAIDLVPDAQAGELMLCHAGIALERLEEMR
jgi:hydrogenase maturation factor